MKRPLALALALATAISTVAAAAEKPRPTIELRAPGELRIALPPTVFEEANKKKLLDTGLTTAIVTIARGRTSRGVGVRVGVRVEISLDLWEETYNVGVIDASGRRNLTFPSLPKLREWWNAARFLLTAMPLADAPANLQVETEIVPFSAGEEADTQRWLAHTMSTDISSAGPPGGGQSSSRREGILDLIIGTSVQRKPVLSWRWNVPVEKR